MLALLQNNDESHEYPISFMSRNLTDDELNYTLTEKRAYDLVKSLNQFKTYVGYSRIVSYVTYLVVKDVLVQHDGLGAREKWIYRVQEYDLDIRPIKIIKGQGLDRMLVEGNEEAIESQDQHETVINIVLNIDEDHEWYKEIIYYLKNMTCPLTSWIISVDH